MNYSCGERLREFRRQRGIDPKELAAAIGISLPAYYDLEDERELLDGISIKKLLTLCHRLRVSPFDLIGFDAYLDDAPRIGTRAFAERINLFLQQEKLSIENFAERSNWNVEEIIKDPHALFDFDLAAIMDVCGVLDSISWCSVLRGLIEEVSLPE